MKQRELFFDSLNHYVKLYCVLFLLLCTFSALLNAGIETISVFQMQYSPIRSITQSQETIYCATENGLLLYDIQSREFKQPVSKESVLFGKDIQAVIYNPHNAMLLALSSGKVFLDINNVRWLALGPLQGKPARYAVTSDATFIAVSEGPVYQISFSTKKVTVVTLPPPELQWNLLRNSYPMPVFDPHTSRHVTLSDYIELPGTEVFAVTSQGEAVIFDRYNHELKRNNSAVFEKTVYAIVESGDLRYIAGKDIWRIDGNNSQKISIHGLSGIFSDVVVVQNKIAVGTRTNGIYILDDMSVEKNITMGQGLFDNTIGFLSASTKYLYAVSPMGATVIDIHSLSAVQKRGTDYMNISTLTTSDSHNAFLKNDGIRITDTDMNILYHISQPLTELSQVIALLLEGNILYIGGKGGLAVMDLNDYTIKLLPQPSGTVTSIVADSQNIYAGTENGFYVIEKNTNRFVRFGKPDGLLSLKIVALFYTKNGVYIQTDKGFNLWTR